MFLYVPGIIDILWHIIVTETIISVTKKDLPLHVEVPGYVRKFSRAEASD